MAQSFRPATLLRDPDSFGRIENVKWKKVPKKEQAVFAAAYLQHRIAFNVRNDLGPNAAEELAKRLGEPKRVDYIRRKLYGQVTVTLNELFEWTLAVGPQIWPGELMNAEGVLPSTR